MNDTENLITVMNDNIINNLNNTYEKITKTDPNWEYIARTNEDNSISVIPIEPANSDYQAYLKSLEDEANTL